MNYNTFTSIRDSCKNHANHEQITSQNIYEQNANKILKKYNYTQTQMRL